MSASEPRPPVEKANRWRVPFLALGLAGGLGGSTMSGGCGEAEEPPPSEWTSEACQTKAPIEICDGVDNGGNGVIDDPDWCWDPISRYKDPSSEARCWGLSSSGEPPAACSAYEWEDDAFSLATEPGPNRFQLVQCSKGSDHVLVDAASAEKTALEGQGYRCDVALGYAYTATGTPPNTPLEFECPLHRWTHESSPGSTSHFFSTSDTIPDATCEPRARAVVPSPAPCLVGTPSGC